MPVTGNGTKRRAGGEGGGLCDTPRGVPATQSAMEDEARRLQMRHGSDFRREGEGEEVWTVIIHPTDPDMPVDVRALALRMTMPPDYPVHPVASVTASGALPAPILAALSKYLNHRLATTKWGGAGTPMVFPFVKMVDNHLSSMLRSIIQLQAEAMDGGGGKEGTTTAPPAASTVPTPAARVPDEVVTRDASLDAAASSAAPAHSVLRGGAQGAPSSFLAQWTWQEQERLERALHTVFRLAPGDVTDPQSWHQVAALVGGGRSPAACMARFILLRHITVQWQRTAFVAADASTTARDDATVHDEDEGGIVEGTAAVQGTGGDATHGDKERQDNGAGASVSTAEGEGDGSDEGEEEGGEAEAEGQGEGEGDGASVEEEPQSAAPEYVWPKYYLAGGRRGHAKSKAEIAAEEEEAAAVAAAEAGVAEMNLAALPFTGISLDVPFKGTQIELQGLSLFGVGTLAASRLSVLVQCSRCGTAVDAHLHGVSLAKRPGATGVDAPVTAGAGGGASGNAGATPTSGMPVVVSSLATPPTSGVTGEHKSWCPKCSLLLSTQFRPQLVHEGNPCVGVVESTHCAVVSLSDMGMFATCLECNAVAEATRLRVPCTWETSCKECFSRLRMDVRGCEMSAIVPRGTAAPVAGVSDGSGGGRAGARFQAGKPLPGNGTCRHYRQSYRWLRFPCCGMAFPCDACHDEASDHVHEWAKRMICGHCAREQPYVKANASCVACGRVLTRGGGPVPRFWEGGLGQRNRSLMSRKDARKYKSSHTKTKSKKAERVGPGAGGS